jgi:hypothetical protein
VKGQAPLSTSLQAEPTYRLGDPISLTFEVENTGSETVQLLRWGTPLEGELTDDCFVVRRDSELLPYDGKLVKRGDPRPESYVTIPPGEKVRQAVDISAGYPIDQPGDYKVTLKAIAVDAFTVAGTAKAAPRKRHQFEPHELPEASAEFTVVPGAEPKLTAGQAARKETSEQQFKTSAKAPSFTGGTATEQSDTVIAHGNAQYFAALAASQLDAGPAGTNALYQTWFGAFDQGRYDNVTKHYRDIAGVLRDEQVTYDLSGSGCSPDVFAFTTKGSRKVSLCSLYLSAPQIGTDCKFGTLVHEWSHGVSSTDDNAYGESACQSLATSDPGKATNNADSHEYFSEHLAQSDFGKSFTFITDRSTFGLDEIDAMLLQASPAVIQSAFYVIADGFWPDRLGITAGSLGASPSVKPTITVSPAVAGMTVTATALEAEDTTLPISPQRFTWVYEIAFSDGSGFPAAAGQVKTVTLTATLGSLSSSAQIQLIREPNPYELDGPTSWLSTDVRVFQLRAGDSRFGATVGSTPASARQFIQQAISNLNGGTSGGQTFDSISTDQQTSVLELSEKVNGTRVFNFAVAKVRYRGTTSIPNVRVLFRLFPASTTSTAFDPSTTYRRATSGANTIPLPGLSAGGDLLTIPCFAADRVDSASVGVDTQTDPPNVRTIAPGAGGSEAAAYFGCWLDINQTQAQLPSHPSPVNGPWTAGRKSLQELMRNAHQCLVAEIAFDPDPIPAGVSPAGSDKLAQRNLAIVESPNPGVDASRRIMTTFDLHPVTTGKVPHAGPDELLIEWRNTPPGSTASVFIPEIDAGQIVALAGERYANHAITQVDGQTVQLPVGGISYVPLPPGASFGVTGLLSVDLTDAVRRGDVYTIVVRQVTDAPPTRVAGGGIEGGTATHVPTRLIRWRRIAGSYQVTIPVRTRDVILPREMRLLSVLRWILRSVDDQDRWLPVFSRYVGLIGDRVGALGGDPDLVEPSPDGSGGEARPSPGKPEPGRRATHDGKVTGLVYDCFGDFEGFLLDDCGTEIAFQAREHEIEALVRTAWRERIAITVVSGAAHPHRPLSIILRRAPEPFQA